MSGQTPERWQQVKAVLAEALERDGPGRRRLLERVGAGDPALRREVEELLALEGADGLTGAVAAEVAAAAVEAEAEAEATGERLGAYLLEAVVGRGGMGTVYRASRADGQYQARVAVKVVRAGLESAAASARFRRERQVLAGLDHPNIARLLDGGQAPDGRLFLVMAYVDGLPIDAACAARRLGLEARLVLFRKVCAAVEHAHRHLVVHRDLKPSNVLVDAEGEPWLVDFGVAALLAGGDEPADPAGATRDLGRFLTPGYASPEHRAGRPVTTASDVYSLGALLHVLLAGRLPVSPGGEVAAGAEGEPLPVSEAAAVGAGPRSGDAPLPAPARLRGDLDRIVAKALRRAPEERYRSVAALDEDLRRLLDGEPVLARPPTFRYRAGKWLRRNRALAATLGAASLLAAAGVGATVWQAHRATLARAAAEQAERRARARFGEVRRLAHAVIYDYSDAIERLSGSVEVRERLVQDALGYLDRLAADAGDDAALQAELADAYLKIGDIQGNPWVSNLGRVADAAESYRKAAGLYLALDRAGPLAPEQRLRLAEAWASALTWAAWARNDLAGALENARRGEALLEAVARERPGDARVAVLRSDLEQSRTQQALWTLADTAGALRHAEAACAAIGAARRADSPDPEDQAEAAYCDHWMASALAPLGSHREAVAHARAAAERVERILAARPDDLYRQVDLAVFLGRLAELLADGDAPAEALAAARRASALMEAVHERNRANGAARYRLSQVERQLAEVALRQGRSAEAGAPSAEALAVARALDGENRGLVTYAPSLAQAALVRGEVLARAGDLVGARAADELAAEAAGRLAAAPEHQEGRWLAGLAAAQAAALDGAGGAGPLREAVAALEAVAARDPASVARRRTLARWYVRMALLTGEPPPPRAGACDGRPWLAKAGAVLREADRAGRWLGDDDRLVPPGPCR